ncbi:MAG TPA: histidine kinase dimerization/phosphoacceptor domain-containing protein, partial [Propionibacteriaceae bacterium]|nr:histidine kinase dimerization/phosphoacceptor domain-containing protein [Propionibacteriaceae bacterium]
WISTPRERSSALCCWQTRGCLVLVPGTTARLRRRRRRCPNSAQSSPGSVRWWSTSGRTGIAVQERLRITRELQDVLGHVLSVMVVREGVAGRFLDTSSDHARRAVEEIARTGRRSLTEMRQILGTLRDGDTNTLDDQSGPGGPAATLDKIEALAQQVQKAGLAVTATQSGDPGTNPSWD